MILTKCLFMALFCLTVSQGASLSSLVASINEKLKVSARNFKEPAINHTDKKTKTLDKQSHGNGNNFTGPPQVLKVMQMLLNDEDKVMLQNLSGLIENAPEISDTEVTRQGKSFKDEHFKRAAEALTDDEITKIIKSISFPNNDDITEDSEALRSPAGHTEIEPRSLETLRLGKSLKTRSGYYVVVFTPVEEQRNNKQHHSVPYTRLQILPAEPAVDNNASNNKPRLISKKAWNKYIRRIMHEIRRGTRKIQRKTKVKSLQEEPAALKALLQRLDKIDQEQQKTKKKSSWFAG